jgi:hypothetical protein
LPFLPDFQVFPKLELRNGSFVFDPKIHKMLGKRVKALSNAGDTPLEWLVCDTLRERQPTDNDFIMYRVLYIYLHYR